MSNGHRNPVKLTHPSMFFCVDSATSMKVQQTNEYVCYKATNQCISTVNKATNQSGLYTAANFAGKSESLSKCLKVNFNPQSHVIRLKGCTKL